MLLIVIAHESEMLSVTAAEKQWLFSEDALMSTGSMLKEQLVRELARLPEERLHEVLHFVESLLRQEQQARAETLLPVRGPEQDPLLQYSGGVAHGSLARDIDQELYGT